MFLWLFRRLLAGADLAEAGSAKAALVGGLGSALGTALDAEVPARLPLLRANSVMNDCKHAKGRSGRIELRPVASSQGYGKLGMPRRPCQVVKWRMGLLRRYAVLPSILLM